MEIDIVGTLERSGLSQSEMADYLGVARPTFNKWCNAKTNIHFLLRDRVAEKLRVIDFLIEEGKLPMRVLRRNKERPRLFAEMLASVGAQV